MKYAIVESGGKQYRAVEGSTIDVDLLHVETGSDVTLDHVLLLADGEEFPLAHPMSREQASRPR